MESVRRIRLFTVAVLTLVLVVSGPLVGAVDFTPPARNETVLGDGTATVTMDSDPADGLRLEQGRFGTGVVYLRTPPAVVDVTDAQGRSRVVYVVEVPSLSYRDSVSERLTTGATGRHRLDLRDRAFAEEARLEGTHEATLTVRVQSFAMDEVVYRHNTTIDSPG
jgi:hypothetical protein